MGVQGGEEVQRRGSMVFLWSEVTTSITGTPPQTQPPPQTMLPSLLSMLIDFACQWKKKDHGCAKKVCGYKHPAEMCQPLPTPITPTIEC